VARVSYIDVHPPIILNRELDLWFIFDPSTPLTSYDETRRAGQLRRNQGIDALMENRKINRKVR